MYEIEGAAVEAILEWGIEVVRAIQAIQSPLLTALMKALTFTGSEYFYLLFLPLLFWCIDERFALRFGLLILVSAFLNGWLKLLFRQPRPYDLDPSLGLSRESSYGLPSGHAQGAATFWGLLAPKFKKPWGIFLALIMPLLIGFTRLYLGVHFPSDLVLGLLLGWGIALAWFFFGYSVESSLAKAQLRARLILISLASIAMNALLPQDTSMSGVFFGTAIGAAFNTEKLGFDAKKGSLGNKLARLSLGIAGLLLIYFGGKLASPGEEDAIYSLVRFMRYALVGAWVSLGAPWLFIKLRLGEARNR